MKFKTIYISQNGIGNVFFLAQEAPSIEKQTEFVENKNIAIFLAEKINAEICLLAPSYTKGIRNGDATVNGKPFEFKTIEVNSKTAIQNAYRKKGKKQAPNILFHVVANIDFEIFIRYLKGIMKESDRIDEIWIIYKEKLEQFTKKQVLNWKPPKKPKS